MTLAFDLLVVAALVWLAWRALRATDLFEAVVLFIAFGLLLALSWARLQAPDLALAEAAIGSGLTGALLLSTLARLRRMDRGDGRDGDAAASDAPIAPALNLLLLAGLAGLLWWIGRAVVALPEATTGLSAAVAANIGASGVTHPVTAVLLNFRAYDTLLEIGVLLLAVVAAWSVASPPRGRPDTREPGRLALPAVLGVLVGLLVPVMIVTAGYLLWLGATAPGGAFHAGALLGGAGVLATLARPAAPLRDDWRVRAVLVAGLAVFLLVGLLVMVPGGRLLQYPGGWAGPLILLIEAAATVSIGATLALLFRGEPPSPEA